MNNHPDWRKLRRHLRRQAAGGNRVAAQILLDIEACELAEDPEKARREIWAKWCKTFDAVADVCDKMLNHLALLEEHADSA